jgi:cell division protein FtsW (lipid II flippase)
MRVPSIDRQLLFLSVGLIGFGLLTLYSAWQTDVPTRAAGVWYRQFIWVGVGMVAAWVVFQVSPRLLEWLAPVLYASPSFWWWCWRSHRRRYGGEQP